ncbi:MAG: 1-deoxy-D-xylulose-5-phosphate reductoisomerase [Lachnospiraceae bacterium]|nr:1-deoxy-D-xylulose-5-phosphate reductoisomerase [Lachnospiraceae bacterium]
MKNISVLGSTGSIGTQTLDVVSRLKNEFNILALTANSNIDLLEKQIYEFKPALAVVMDEKKAVLLKGRLKNSKTEIMYGMEGLVCAATLPEADIIVTAVVGNIGLLPTVKAIECKKTIALANKETFVSAGEIVMSKVHLNGAKIYPVDSEHSAIFQCIQGNIGNEVSRILLTASGGPFRTKTINELEKVTLEDALRHPNWSMGKKVTIDSATMLNKGLELIEAKWLFNISPDKIEVLVHPESIVHSAVEFEDGAVIAQLGEPDMRLPIQYALTFPKRIDTKLPKIDFEERCTFNFEKPDLNKFRCLYLAKEAVKTGGSMPAVLNASNEIAVSKFISGKIKFLDISRIIEKTMNAYTVKYNCSLDDIFEADRWAREYADNLNV